MLIGSDEAEIKVQMYNSTHVLSTLTIHSLVCVGIGIKILSGFLYNFKSVSLLIHSTSPDSVTNHNFKGNKLATIS